MKRLLTLALLALLSFSVAAAPPPKAKAPTVKATGATLTDSATLNWTAVTQGLQNGATVTLTPPVTYSIYESTLAAGSTCSTTGLTQQATGLTALTDTLTLSGLTAGQVLCFAVNATALGVTGPYSNLVTVTVPSPPAPTPSAPTQLTVTVVFVSAQ
jgi:hypothetical protein